MSGITLTSSTNIPQLSFNHLEMNETLLSCVLPDKISSPIIKIAAFTFLFFSSYFNNEFESKLISGTLIKRYKRFFVDVKIQNETVTAHCPNTGSMFGLLNPGAKVWITRSLNPERKLKYTLQIIEQNGKKVGVNTHLTNKIFFESLSKNKITAFHNIEKIEKEKKYNNKTRFDFMIEKKIKKGFIEVKNVTLSRIKKIAEFPDAVTSRGSKHLIELVNASKKRL